MTLSHEQQAAFDLIESTDKNVLILGEPGVGKSVLIRALLETGSKYYTIAAPTGLAALNVKGKTLHSLCGINPSSGIFAQDYNRFTSNDNVRNYIHHRLKCLVIDEISMVRADMLDYIDRFLRECKGVDLPFGGVQIVAVGDFFQLPPVANAQDKKDLLAAGYSSEFAFSAKCFTSFSVVQLTTIHRQADPKFINILKAARVGKVNAKHLHTLNKQVGAPNDLRIRLVPINKQADEVNFTELAKIKMPVASYEAKKFGYWPQSPVNDLLQLKVGAQVLIKKNSANRPPNQRGEFHSRIVNGTLATVVELPNEDNKRVLVRLEDGSEEPIWLARWERSEKERVNNQWNERVVAWYEQYPLQLAWAISIHKSQGQTFEKVHIDGKKIFAPGQMYVALSRCKSIEGISFESQLTERMFFANKDVLKFTKQL